MFEKSFEIGSIYKLENGKYFVIRDIKVSVHRGGVSVKSFGDLYDADCQLLTENPVPHDLFWDNISDMVEKVNISPENAIKVFAPSA